MEAAPAEIRLVLLSVPDRETGVRLVETLVAERHAACGSVVPGATSIYWWKGQVERADEALVILKTTDACTANLLPRAAELHPYEVPEILVLPLAGGHSPYLDWVRTEVRTG